LALRLEAEALEEVDDPEQGVVLDRDPVDQSRAGELAPDDLHEDGEHRRARLRLAHLRVGDADAVAALGDLRPGAVLEVCQISFEYCHDESFRDSTITCSRRRRAPCSAWRDRRGTFPCRGPR